MNNKRRCLYCSSENVTVNIDVQNFASLIQENKFYIGKPDIQGHIRLYFLALHSSKQVALTA